jgi:hypothetical protein
MNKYHGERIDQLKPQMITRLAEAQMLIDYSFEQLFQDLIDRMNSGMTLAYAADEFCKEAQVVEARRIAIEEGLLQ